MEFDRWSNKVIGCAVEVHRHLGPGLLESVYSKCLAHEMELCGLHFTRETSLPGCYKGMTIEGGYRVDFLVEDELIVELKSTETILPLYQAQLLSYLKPSGKNTGLIMNFNVPLLKAGIKRMVL